jgi:YVTN family beta-propeller protein
VLDLDKRSVVGTVKVGDAPSAATVDSDAHIVYVTNSGSASVSVIDSQKRAVTDTVQVRDGPQTVAADPSTHIAWVVNFKDNSISVIAR